MRWRDTQQEGTGKRMFNPRKMKKKYNKFTERYLVPAVLFLLNICLAHVIYAFVSASSYRRIDKIVLAVAFVLMTSSLLLRRQMLLAGSILFYMLAVLWI